MPFGNRCPSSSIDRTPRPVPAELSTEIWYVRGPMAIDHLKSRPAWRDARLEAKGVAFHAETEDRFQCDAVQPTRRAGVPRPAAATGVRRSAIHIGADHVRLDLVVLHLGRCRGMVDRIDQVPEFQSAIPAALQRCRQHDPSRRVRVLAAVLANARHIPLDVAGLQCASCRTAGRTAESVCRQHAPDVSRTASIADCARAGSATPDITAHACGIASIWHSSFCADPSGVPSSKYARRYQAPSQAFASSAARKSLGSLPTPVRMCCLSAPLGQPRKRVQHRDKEPPVPDALALAVRAHLIHAVVPVAGAHERQSVRPEPIAVLKSAHAVLVERASLLADRRQVEILLLVRREAPAI